MKKIMIAIASAAFAVAAHAAAYNWSFDAEGNSPFGGATYYAVNGTITDYVTALSGTGYDAFVSAIASADYTKGSLDNTGAAAGAVSENAATTFSVIVLADTTGGSTFYYTSISTDGYTFTPPAGSPGALEVFAFSETGTLDMSTGTIANVPEPTSGLLLLLGMASLALKRKRA